MVDLFALLVSLGMLAIVVFFALRLDRTRPWFERPRRPGKPAAAQPGRAGAARPARPARFPTRP